MNISSRPQGQASAPAQDGPLPIPQDNTRRNITYMLIAAWLVLVIGKALGLVTANYETDALLVGSVGVAFGYLYGRTVKIEEIKELSGVSRNAGISPIQEPR